MEKDEKLNILIVDDAEMNRMILREMLQDGYGIVEADNGRDALRLIEDPNAQVDLVLLDCVMPQMDGFEVLKQMSRIGLQLDIPVIMISAESDRAFIVEAYRLGAVDYITRPFDSVIVRHRVNGVMRMYRKEKHFFELASSQIFEKYHNNNMLMHILSGIVEFRNGESGRHILNVQALTDLFLREIVNLTDAYHLTNEDISMIDTAAAIHDVGKISIPGKILNKPGRFTDEEFAIMKTHTTVGDEMLAQLSFYQEEPLLKLSRQVVRWHHERFDGRGYPDGLKGDEIPIAAQVVSIADVYDALTSERCYKKAFPHEEAVRMIKNGECGQFNPLLLQCLDNLYDVIPERLQSDPASQIDEKEMKRLVEEIMTADS